MKHSRDEKKKAAWEGLCHTEVTGVYPCSGKARAVNALLAPYRRQLGPGRRSNKRSLLIGVPVGIGMAASSLSNRALRPLVYFSYPIPKTALLPVAMLLLRIDNGSKILILVLTTVLQVIVAVRDAAAHVDPGVYSVARSAWKLPYQRYPDVRRHRRHSDSRSIAFLLLDLARSRLCRR